MLPTPPRFNTSTHHPLCSASPQHGEGLGDKFSVDYIFQAAEKAAGGTPATGVDEAKWLAAFLQARYNLLASWDSTSAASVNRIKIYQELLKLGERRGVGVEVALCRCGRWMERLCLDAAGARESVCAEWPVVSCCLPPSLHILRRACQATSTWTAPSTSI